MRSSLQDERSADIPAIVTRYAAGESPLELAKECGVDKSTLLRRIKTWTLTGDCDVDYDKLVTEVLALRVAEADEQLDEAVQPHEIARAREKARFARMDLERRRPALYGPKQEVKHSGGAPTLNIVLLDRPTTTGGVLIEGNQVPPALPAPGGETEEANG